MENYANKSIDHENQPDVTQTHEGGFESFSQIKRNSDDLTNAQSLKNDNGQV